MLVHSYCTVTAQLLQSYCTVTAQSLHSHCKVTAQSLHSHCKVTAPPNNVDNYNKTKVCLKQTEESLHPRSSALCLQPGFSALLAAKGISAMLTLCSSCLLLLIKSPCVDFQRSLLIPLSAGWVNTMMVYLMGSFWPGFNKGVLSFHH